MSKKRRVVITGLGPLSPLGFGKEELWKSILAESTGLKKEDFIIGNKSWDSFWLHKIEGFDIGRFDIDRQPLDELNSWKEGREDKDLLYAAAAISLALKDSKLKYNRLDNNISLFMTAEHPGFEKFCEELSEGIFRYLQTKSAPKDKIVLDKQDILKHFYKQLVDRSYDLHSFMYLFHLAKIFNIHGYSLFNNNACASGLFAIESASGQIRQGNSDVAIVAGGDCPLNIFKHIWFKERNLYADDGRVKPFSKAANGIVFGEGYSAIILEDLEHALKRKANIYAEYLGGGFSLEGWKVVFPQVGSNSYQKSIQEALKVSGCKPKDIDLVNPHGVGIRITDRYEAKAISDTFGSKTPVSAFKPYVGHNLGGSAIIETIILLLCLQNNLIPATLNCEEFDSVNKINLIRKPVKIRLKTVVKLSCGFAGYNAAAAFRKS